MIINIRLGVFETNSSSAHSIIITNSAGEFSQEEIEKSLWINIDGILSFKNTYDLEFDRSPFDVLYTPREKVCYLYASYSCEEDKINEINDILKELCPNIKDIEFKEDDILMADYVHGYVDHQSAYLLDSYLTKNNISIKEFIVRKCYIVIIDGDEYNVLGKFKRCGLLDESKIKDIKISI